MNIISTITGFLKSNLGGILGTKWFFAILLSVFVFLITTIITFQNQKDNLREDIIEITSELKSNKTEFIYRLKEQTENHNNIIKNMITNEELERLNNKLNNEINKNNIKETENEILNNKLIELNKINNDYFKCEIPEEIKKILNKEK